MRREVGWGIVWVEPTGDKNTPFGWANQFQGRCLGCAVICLAPLFSTHNLGMSESRHQRHTADQVS
jgi:hypothetical protein